MKNYIKKISLLLMLVAISSSIFLSSCKKKEDIGTAPEVPPKGAFVMDYSTFQDNDKNLKSEKWAGNVLVAATQVSVWSIILTVGLAVPVAAYVEALKHVPEHSAGTTWLWQYEVPVGWATYTAKLYGTKEADQVTWEMYLSKNGDDNFQDFLWYEGYNNLTGTKGQWTLYKSNTDPTKYLQIDWTKNAEDTTGTIKYTNIVPNGSENGGYITYGNAQEGEYNAYYHIYNKGLDNLTQIEWSTENKNGHIKNPNWFKDENWHCWGTDFSDIVCE